MVSLKRLSLSGCLLIFGGVWAMDPGKAPVSPESTKAEDQCSICWQSKTNKATAAPFDCVHTFCDKCIADWINEHGRDSRCPLCQRPLDTTWDCPAPLTHQARARLNIFGSPFSELNTNLYKIINYGGATWNDISRLVALGADVNAIEQGSGETPLIAAIVYGGWNNTPVRLLLEHGADANRAATSGNRQTPLIYAAWRGDIEITRLLLEHGARTSDKDSNGHTAYDIIMREFTEEPVRRGLAKLLAPQHAAGPAREKASPAVQEQLLDSVITRDAQRLHALLDGYAFDLNVAALPDGTTPLMLAAQTGDPATVKALLDAGARPEIRTSQNQIARDFTESPEIHELLDNVQHARRRYTPEPEKSGNADFANKDIAGPASPDTLSKGKELLNGRIQTRIETASKEALMMFLTPKKGEASLKTLVETTVFQDNSVLYRASRATPESEKHEADSAEKKLHILNTVMIAIQSGNMDYQFDNLLERLRSENAADLVAALNTNDAQGDTPLTLAVTLPGEQRPGIAAVVLSLLKYGANIDAKNGKGDSPLLAAVKCNGSRALIRMLIAHGADTKICDFNETSAIDFALDHHYDDIVRLVLKLKK